MLGIEKNIYDWNQEGLHCWWFSTLLINIFFIYISLLILWLSRSFEAHFTDQPLRCIKPFRNPLAVFFLAFKFLFLLLLYLNFFTFKWWSSLYEMYKKMQSVLTIITIVVKIGSKISDFLRMTLTMAWWWRFLKTISVFALYIEGKNIPRDLRSIYPFPNHLVLKHHADDKKMFLKFFLIFSYSSSVLTLSNWIYVFFFGDERLTDYENLLRQNRYLNYVNLDQFSVQTLSNWNRCHSHNHLTFIHSFNSYELVIF